MNGDDCTCYTTAMEPDPDCPVHFPAPEMFPGTLAALDALTIRKETP